MYHDIVTLDKTDLSGFPGTAAATYKISPKSFREHLENIAKRVKIPPVTVFNINDIIEQRTAWMITFDDGGCGAVLHAAKILESYGFLGHFFITTDYIDRPGFLKKKDICELRYRGHVIGSHSRSHPENMSLLSSEEIFNEWNSSLSVLSDILNEQVNVASLPSGFYSRRIAIAAIKAGIKYLFTSEPTNKITEVNKCSIIGRYIIKTSTPPFVAADLAAGHLIPRLHQWYWWNSKKAAKMILRDRYNSLRRYLLRL